MPKFIVGEEVYYTHLISIAKKVTILAIKERGYLKPKYLVNMHTKNLYEWANERNLTKVENARS